MNKKQFIIFILLNSLMLPQAYCEPKTTITLVTENLPPYQMLIKNKLDGFATEIITEVMKQTDFEYTIKLYPWSRSYNYAQKKKNTCIFSIARSPKREHLFQWVQAIATSSPSFIGLKSKNHIKINTIEDAKKYKIAVIRDDISHQILVKYGFEEFKHFYVVNNSESLLKLLLTRKNIDLILVDPLTIPFRSSHNNIDQEKFMDFYQLKQEEQIFYLACSNITPPNIIKTLHKAITTVKKNGLYQKIINKWSIQYRGILNE